MLISSKVEKNVLISSAVQNKMFHNDEVDERLQERNKSLG